jgi:CRISPR system Cascade subunit CasC
MEDRPEPDATGASFLGDTAFNSATYYKYLNIHWQGLLNNLGWNSRQDVPQKELYNLALLVVKALLRAAMTAIPTGKQNAFAAHNMPDLALVEVLERNIPLSYANAFLKPVRPHKEELYEVESLIEASAAAIIAYAGPLPGCYQLPVKRCLFTTPLVTLPDLKRHQFDAEVCHNTTKLAEWLDKNVPMSEA